MYKIKLANSTECTLFDTMLVKRATRLCELFHNGFLKTLVAFSFQDVSSRKDCSR